MRLAGPAARYGSAQSGRAGGASAAVQEGLQPDDHDFGGFHERCDRLAFFQAQLADSVCSDDGGNALPSDGERHLRYEAVNFYVGDATDELVATADAAKVCASFGNVAMFGRTI